jgi:hypothetical protein
MMFCSAYSLAQNTLPTSGNVGIGTTNPTTELEVIGNTNLSGTVTIDSAVTVRDSATFQKKLTVNQDLKIKGTSVFIDDARFKSELKVLGVAKMKDKLVVDGLTKMNGDANVFGNFRIKSLADSTTTADRWLTINPNGKVTSLDKSGLMSAIYQPPQTCFYTGNNVALPVWSSTSTPNYGVLFTGIDCPARVGIGTNNPSAALSVIGSGFFSSTLGINTVPTNQYQLHVNNSVGTTAGIYLNTNHPQNWPNVKYGFQNVVNNPNTIAYSVTDATTNQDVFVVMGDGKTGIGTANPEGDLQVRSGPTKLVIGSSAGEDLGWGTSYIGFNAVRTANNTWGTSGDGAHNGGAIIYGDIFGSIIFSTIPFNGNTNQTNIADATVKENTRLFIHRDGNVGIGTTAVLGAKLSVEGSIRARKIQVDNPSLGWSDFVFDENYQLPTLEYVESFITNNHHLPDVPSASEVAANGIDLAQMDAILLQKIEELTLYLLQLKKENDSLKEKIILLETK